MSISPNRIALEGEVSIFTADEIHDRLLAVLFDGQEVEVDISRVSEIDGAGLQLIVAARHQAFALDKTLRFIKPSEAVLQMLELCDLMSLLEDQAVTPRAEPV